MKCDYHGCEYEGPDYEFTEFQGPCNEYYACPFHVNVIEDTTGYCGMACQFGYGCDQSC